MRKPLPEIMDYGIVGNCNTCALVSRDAGVHWMCFPDFDSPSIFAKILDEKKGGTFEVIPDRKCRTSQEYIKHTNVLQTTFSCDEYSFRVLDFFPRYKKLLPSKRGANFRKNSLIRIVEPLKGTPKLRYVFDPRLDYAREETSIVKEEFGIRASKNGFEIRLFTNADIGKIHKKSFQELNKDAYFVLGEDQDPENINMQTCRALLEATKEYWERWVESLVLPNTNRDAIIRSSLVLKLLTYSKTGAIIAAPTTSIPEENGSERTWDYRYCWVRDATYCADALKKIGRGFESKRLTRFLMSRALKNDYIQIMYGINGETSLKEYFLEHLSGYKDSRPVRIGNAAYKQHQHDIYGELIEIMYLYFVYYEYETRMSPQYWRFLKYLVNQIRFSWEREDSGIWEFREKYAHYTFSKMMCFVGVDRAVKIAQHFGRNDLVEEWLPLKDEISLDMLKNGYNQKKGSFTISYGSNDLDAALLLMAYHEVLEPSDPRLINTVKAIYNELTEEGYLVQRYKIVDDFGKSKSAFTICSFWLIQALAYIGEKEKAQEIYEKLMKSGNHLGLFSEDIDLETKELRGNFPQAYTHIAIINTSILLSEWSEARKKINWDEIKAKNVL